MKFALILALSSIAPVLAAQTSVGGALGQAKQAPDPVLLEPAITAVSSTYAQNPEEIVILGSALGVTTEVTVGGLAATILERTNDLLRVQLPANHDPGYWPVVAAGPAGVAAAQTELWPTITVTPMDGLWDPVSGFRVVDRKIMGLNIHNGTGGVFILAASLGERAAPMIYPGTGFLMCLDDPVHVMAIGVIPASGILREQFAWPLRFSPGELHIQAWASQFRPIQSEACFTNMLVMPF